MSANVTFVCDRCGPFEKERSELLDADWTVEVSHPTHQNAHTMLFNRASKSR